MGRIASILRQPVAGPLSGALLALLVPIAGVHLAAARFDGAGIDTVWFPALLVGGVLAAGITLATVSRPDTSHRQPVVLAGGLVLSLLGLGFLAGPWDGRIDYGGGVGLVLGAATLAGGLGLAADALRGPEDRPAPATGFWPQLCRTPLAVLLGSPLLVMFAVEGPLAAALAAIFLGSPTLVILCVLFLTAWRGLSDSRPRRLTHAIAAIGGALVLLGLAGDSRGCADVWVPGPTSVNFEGGRIVFGTCTTVFQPLVFGAGAALLVAAPLAHWRLSRVGSDR